MVPFTPKVRTRIYSRTVGAHGAGPARAGAWTRQAIEIDCLCCGARPGRPCVEKGAERAPHLIRELKAGRDGRTVEVRGA